MKIPEGWGEGGLRKKKPSAREVWIFSGTKHFVLEIKIMLQKVGKKTWIAPPCYRYILV